MKHDLRDNMTRYEPTGYMDYSGLERMQSIYQDQCTERVKAGFHFCGGRNSGWMFLIVPNLGCAVKLSTSTRIVQFSQGISPTL